MEFDTPGNRRQADRARALPLAAAGRERSDAAPVRGDGTMENENSGSCVHI